MSTTSPDAPERKRRRKVLSCWDCRRRKLQCDRAVPACSRCVKAGKPESCLYIEDTDAERTSVIARTEKGHTISNEPKSGIDLDVISRLDSKDRRIRELEATLVHTGRNPNISARERSLPDSDSNAPAAADRESMVLRGGSFKTRYFGNTHPGAILSFIPELGEFTKEAFERYPALKQMRRDTHKLDKLTVPEDDHFAQVLDSDLRALMIPKAEADELVHLYVDTFETIYHVLHLPTFWKAYEEMWIDINAAPGQFVATVLTMMACVSCLSSQPQRYVAHSSTARNRSLHWLRHCENWISARSQKHVTAADFQIRCLLWLAKQTSFRKCKRAWTDAGDLLRFCMSAGLHRNPDMIQKHTSVLDKELRRRVWATAVDFELQASFDRGMVSAPWLLQSDCTGPSNLHDEDLSGDQTFTSRSIREFTTASYLALSNDTLMLRSTLNAVLNNIRQTLTFDEVKHYTDEIEAHIAAIPDWIDRRSDVPKALLSLRLRQYLMCLHDRNLRQASTAAERNMSKSILLETSLQIVETHKSLVAKGNFALELYCLDPLRTAVSITHLQSFIDARADIALSRSFDVLTPDLLGDVIGMVQDKFYRFGQGGREVWLSIVCDTILKLRRQPDQKEALMQQAVEKVVSPMYKILACQEMTPTKSVSSWPNGNETKQLSAMSDVNMQQLPMSGVAIQDLLTLDEMEDWTFQDWFNAADFQNIYQPLPDLAFEPIQR